MQGVLACHVKAAEAWTLDLYLPWQLKFSFQSLLLIPYNQELFRFSTFEIFSTFGKTYLGAKGFV
jgi:hypothetical protein